MSKDIQIRAWAAASFILVPALAILAYRMFRGNNQLLKAVAVLLALILIIPVYNLFFDFKFFNTKSSAWRRLTTGDDIMESKTLR